MTLDPTAVQILTGGGTVGLILGLIITVWALATRKVIVRGTFDDLVAERDEWKRQYFEESERADQAVESVSGLTTMVKEVLDYVLDDDDPPPKRRRR